MVIFLCEDSVDGIFTGVYEAWASRLGHSNVALRTAGLSNLELFAEYRTVITDAGKAARVANTIRQKMGEESYEKIYQASLANADDKSDCIYRVLTVGVSVHTDPWLAHHLMEKLQDPNVCRVSELSWKVFHEAHRYTGFVRFRELDEGVLFSEIEAEHQVLPLIGEHFSDRFPQENFMIYDHHSGDCLLHGSGKPWFIWKNAEIDNILKRDCSANEQEIQALWRTFCESIAIRERRNPHLQMQFWPLRFRKWMTEGNDS
ncbi:MAG: TIGR03915 family putative DNA repair protein [Lachnospiraceae bacterium]|nr:TIGR03915 family putative DNA repair protein [Lachnospiraceae bacterium]